MLYFRNAYSASGDSDSLVNLVVAAFHLATKVYEQPRSLPAVIEVLDRARNNSELIKSLPALGNLVRITDDFRKVMTKRLIRAENDLIYHLDFDFRFPLPYDFTLQFIERLVRFHVRAHDVRFQRVVHDLQDASWVFLNDLQQSHLFTMYSPDIVAWAAVALSFEMFAVTVVHIARQTCQSVLLPYRNLDEIEEAHRKIRQFFQEYRILDNHRQLSVEMDPKFLQTWYIAPLEEIKPIDEMCPPPPLELMQQIAGDHDAFNSAWWDHLPDVEPPNLEQLAEFAANQPWVNKRLRDGAEDTESQEVGDTLPRSHSGPIERPASLVLQDAQSPPRKQERPQPRPRPKEAPPPPQDTIDPRRARSRSKSVQPKQETEANAAQKTQPDPKQEPQPKGKQGSKQEQPPKQKQEHETRDGHAKQQPKQEEPERRPRDEINPRTRSDPDRRAREEPLRRYRDSVDSARDDVDRRYRSDPERRLRDDPDRVCRDDADHRSRDDPDRRHRDDPEHRSREDPDRKYRDDPEHRSRNNPERRLRDEPDRRFREDLDARPRDDPDRRMRDGPDRRMRDEQDRRFREEPERRLRDEPDRRMREEQDHRFAEEEIVD